jgi:hypothetical protein
MLLAFGVLAGRSFSDWPKRPADEHVSMIA